MASNLFTTDHTDNKLRKMSGFSSTISNSLSLTGVLSVTYDGTNVYWNLNASSFKKGSGFSTTVGSSFTHTVLTTGYDQYWDGTNLYCVGDTTKAYKQSGFSATISASFATTNTNMRGMALDGSGNSLNTELNGGAFEHAKHSGFTATISSSFKTNAGNRGVAWDGTNLMSAFNSTGKYRQYSGFGSTVNSSFTLGTDANGIDWQADAAAASAPDIVNPPMMSLLGVGL